MNVNLPSKVTEFVKNLVLDGRFDSEEAAVAEGLRLLMSREQLRDEIQKGTAQLDAGQSFDSETVFRELNEEIDKVEAEQQGSS